MSHIEPDSRVRPVFPAELFLVYGSLRTGGIETLIIRMANYFVSEGVRINVCCSANGEFQALLDSKVNVVIYKETVDLIKTINALDHTKYTGSRVLVMSFDPISAARALKVEMALSKTLLVTHVSGVFHPRAYFMTGERKDRIFLNYLLARAIGKDRLFFMNKECRESHSIKWGADFSSSPIIALPINCFYASWKPSGKAKVRVVSVGRLVDFKAYNLGAARIVRDSLDRGIEVTWDIFGDGPLCNSIEAEIEVSGMANYVQLMGPLDYNDFSTTVADYDFFIGMGTAALEAAMVGIPTICATVDEASRCYGYLHELPFGNLGELQAYPPNVGITDLIQSYSLSNQEYKRQLSMSGRAVAEKYGMPQFVEAIRYMLDIGNAPPPKFNKRIIAELYCLATESVVVKILRHFSSRKFI